MPAVADNPRGYMTGHQREILDWAKDPGRPGRPARFTAAQAAGPSGCVDARHAADELRSLVVGRFFTVDGDTYTLAERGMRT